MDLSALRARCTARMRDTGNAIWSTANWDDYLNDAYRDINATSYLWPWMELRSTSVTLTAGTRSASLPTDAFRVSAVWNSTAKLPMVAIEGRSDYRHLFPGGDESGVGTAYRLRNSTIEVYPLVDTATTLHIDYMATPSLLSAGTDVPAMPTQYHHMLVEGAMARAYQDDGAPDQAQLHQAKFDRILEGMAADLLSGRNDSYYQVLDTWD